MNTFVDAINRPAGIGHNNLARTENGMRAVATTGSAIVDLFYAAGASRGKDLSVQFHSAYKEDRVRALRLLAWVRDVRGGAGEREVARKLLQTIELNYPHELEQLIPLIPFYGRWDDLLVFKTDEGRALAFDAIIKALQAGNGLCAKWMPRKGDDAIMLRRHMGLTPKQYRRLLVGLTKVVEQQMCAKNWSEIEYSHVSSVAAQRYQKAFAKHDKERYNQYRQDLQKPALVKAGEVKINVGAVYPYDIIKTFNQNRDALTAQAAWDALPNYVGKASILPIVDTSGSMHSSIDRNLRVVDVAASLGMYLASKNRGVFQDVFMTFNTDPKFIQMKGTFAQKLEQVYRATWGGSTDLHKSMDLILATAVKGNVPATDMPEFLLILSDMQFNFCARYDDRAIDMIARKFNDAGYEMPKVVFWNLRDAPGNKPVTVGENGVALVSGFSPAIVKSVLKADKFTPLDVVLATLDGARYNAIV
jgi:hypothetical protein